MIPVTLDEIQQQLFNGELTLSSIVESYLKKIQTLEHLNIYLEVFEDEVKEGAKILDKKIKTYPEKCGRLIGCVFSIKDVICYRNHKVSAGSKILEDFESLYTSTAVERLLNEDALIIGRTNCDEFAMGSANANSAYGPTINGIGENRVPGGSSGGSAVSVQMDTCLMSLGSDTGGSVRQPAAFCGIIGLKPTYGRISRYGLIAYASSFDQIGVFGKDLSTISRCLEIMGGKDQYDATTTDLSVKDLSKINKISSKLKIAYFHQVMHHSTIQSEVLSQTNTILQRLKQSGHQLNEVDFRYLDYLVPTYYILTTAEASSNLGRYDGIRYGYKTENSQGLYDYYVKTRSEGFGSEVKRRIMMGSFVLSVGFYDAYFTKAQKIRKLIKDEIESILSNNDCIILPTTPNTAWKHGDTKDDPLAEFLADIFTVLANLAGIPAITIPIGLDKNNLPIGLQILVAQNKEKDLLAIANYILGLA